eukprot:9716539-Alexandrium_andersonii.AAC.1
MCAAWAGEACRATRAGTWDGPSQKVLERAKASAAARQSPATCAAQWNIFTVSCIPYAAQLTTPGLVVERRLKEAYRTANKGWAWA